MSEALILYRGRGGVDPELLKPTTITSNGNYVAPVTGNYMVYTVGGGGGGGGGCRNSWNPSQVFYGSGGSRGALNTKTVFLNAGDQVPVSLGAGGSGGTNNTTVVSNNSRGTNGGSGGTTSFGSYASAAGGTYGAWSWHYHYWYNWIMGYQYRWSGAYISDRNVYMAMFNSARLELNGIWATYYPGNWNGYHIMWVLAPVINTQWFTLDSTIPLYRAKFTNGVYAPVENITSLCAEGYINQSNLYNLTDGVKRSIYNFREFNKHYGAGTDYGVTISTSTKRFYLAGFYDNTSNAYTMINEVMKKLGNSSSLSFRAMTQYYSYTYIGTANVGTAWSATPYWNNYISNTSTRCYTSIQQGTWWYTDNNAVSTSGTRTYRGDGGASGQAGNAGFILVIPPQS